ncbi:MAG: DNA-3-methyladenine glycosylase [Firmicutes bacterium]|nr:DNA-3-methyladenine glycosylase [Bacillota bacterium]
MPSVRLKDLKPLDYSFYARDTIKAAKELLGKVLVHKEGKDSAAGIIVETEAYLGSNDPASHAARKKTPRNSVMFGQPGKAYVYFIYGNHFCVNAVAHDGYAGAVLIRALEPVLGIGIMKKRRKQEDLQALTNGPGKLAQALGITRIHNEKDLVKSNFYIADAGIKIRLQQIAASGRIGIKEAEEMQYRFYIKGNKFVSR